MDRRALVTAILVMATLIAVAPTAGAGVDVLLLPDSSGAGTKSLVKALRGAGHKVVVGPIEYTWDGSNPPTSGFDVVVHLNGANFNSVPPVAGQLALVEFVSSGGGYVGGQWNGFEAATGLLVDMVDLVLQLWSYPDLDPNTIPPDYCQECSMAWTVALGREGHPLLDGVPSPFTFFADGHAPGPIVDFGDPFPSVVLMTSPSGKPAVTVREFEDGRIVAFSVAANFSSALIFEDQKSQDNSLGLTLQDENIQRLYINAVSWAASEPTPPTPPPTSTIEGLMKLVDALEGSGALNKGRANALMSKLDAAARQIDRGNFNAAESQMWAFVNQVETWIRSGVLTEKDGEPLLVNADQIIADLAG